MSVFFSLALPQMRLHSILTKHAGEDELLQKDQARYSPLKQVLRKTDFLEDNRVENQM